MKSVCTPIRPSQLTHGFAANSGPLSERMYSRTARHDKRSASRSSTSCELQPAALRRSPGIARELVERQHPQRPAVVRAVEDEVVAPDMVRMLGAPPHDRAVGQPEPAAFRLLLRHFQTFPAPEPFHALVVHPPAFA